MSNFLSNEDYAKLYVADFIMAGALGPVLNNNGAHHLTVCPLCHVDDFQHVAGCEMIHATDDI